MRAPQESTRQRTHSHTRVRMQPENSHHRKHTRRTRPLGNTHTHIHTGAPQENIGHRKRTNKRITSTQKQHTRTHTHSHTHTLTRARARTRIHRRSLHSSPQNPSGCTGM